MTAENPNQKRWKEDETRRVHWLSSTNCTAVEWDRSARSRRPGGTPFPSAQLPARYTDRVHPPAGRERERVRETPLFRAQRRRLAGRGRSRRPSRPVTTVARGRRATGQQASAVRTQQRLRPTGPALTRRPGPAPAGGTRVPQFYAPRRATRRAALRPPAPGACLPAALPARSTGQSGQSHADALLHRTRLCVARRAATAEGRGTTAAFRD